MSRNPGTPQQPLSRYGSGCGRRARREFRLGCGIPVLQHRQRPRYLPPKRLRLRPHISLRPNSISPFSTAILVTPTTRSSRAYLADAKAVTIEDPYIRAPHQIANFVRFCETVVRAGPTVRRINLITGYDDKTDLTMVRDKLEELKQSLLEVDVLLEIQLSENIHDREVRIDNGWTIKIGRGLDFYQKPDGWFSIGASDLSLRKCLETKVDIFKQEKRPAAIAPRQSREVRRREPA